MTRPLTSFGPFRLDTANRRLYNGSAETRLTPKATAILEILVARPNQLITHDELLDAVWHGVHVQPEVLKVYVAELRRALRDPADKPKYIETVHRRGYRFMRPGNESKSGRDTSGLLVGRAGEMSTLNRLMREAANGHRQVVFITGETGIGKTTLVNSFVHRIQSKPGICAAVGDVARASGEGEPFSPILSALIKILKGSYREPLIAAFRQNAPGWMLQFPSLLDPGEIDRIAKDLMGATSQRMIREFAEAIESFTQNSLLVLGLDDIHRAGASTLDLLEYLASRQAPAKLMVVAAAGDGSDEARVRSMISSLHARRLCEEIKPGPLSEDAVRRFLDARYPPSVVGETLAAQLHRLSGGVPLFLTSVAYYMEMQGWILKTGSAWIPSTEAVRLEEMLPPTLKELVDLRIRQLSHEDQRILEAASIAGMEFEPAFVANALDEPSEPVEEACIRIERQGGWLQSSGFSTGSAEGATPKFKFLHKLLREVLYCRQSPAERVQRHRRVATGLETHLGQFSRISAPELAQHFAVGRECSKSIQYLRTAAEGAQHRYAGAEAAVLLTQALAYASRLPKDFRADTELEILNDLGSAYFTSGNFDRAAHVWHKVLMKAMDLGRPDIAVNALNRLAFPVGWDNPSRLISAADRVLAHAGEIEDPVARAEVTIRALAMSDIAGSSDPNLLTSALEALQVILADRNPIRIASARIASALLRLRYSDYHGVIIDLEESLPVAMEHNLIDVIQAEYSLSWALLHAGQFGRMQSIASTGAEHARMNGAGRIEVLFLTQLAWLHVECGAFDSARELCLRVAALSGNPSAGIGSAMFHVIAGMAAIGCQNFKDALDHVHLPSYAHLPPDHFWRVMVEMNALRLHLLARSEPEAQRSVRRILRISVNIPEKTWKAVAMALCASAEAVADRRVPASEHLSVALQLLDNADLPLAQWRVQAIAADLAENAESKEALDFRQQSRDSRQLLFDSLSANDELKSFARSKPII
ncbi:MAG TPA: AAA family ATPase [Bryobacteraceae bacterium]|nr:AAA family ATPase [Bryobacteraceae bacterium]